MRLPRIVILVLFFVASLFLFCRSIASLRRPHPASIAAAPPKAQIRSYFSWSVPFALFPPNAAISLTDDNSTFFPARPATFGPPLPARGLSGQLWIGSGFVDDNLQDGEGEGELGCSDVPGWEDGLTALALPILDKAAKKPESSAGLAAKAKNSKRDALNDDDFDDEVASKRLENKIKAKTVDDGTDDYLQHGLQPKRSSHDSSIKSSSSSHADIQSIQEAAEITGKVVLLSRGGCGFLEKVKWAQRRGALALIVGDNVKGGPLIQMSAHGDVSNITIPSIFTSRTTAHLLSSLMQPGSFIEDIVDERGNAAFKVQHYDKARKGTKAKVAPAATTTTLPRATTPSKSKVANMRKDVSSSNRDAGFAAPTSSGWFSWLFRWGSKPSKTSDRSRPPSSGRLDWVLVDEWSDEKDKMIQTSLDKASKGSSAKSNGKAVSEDNFQIGVQDWRDPDLVDSASSLADESPLLESSRAKGQPAKLALSGHLRLSSDDSDGPQGGSITPGSGEYSAEMVKARQGGSAGSRGSDGGRKTHGGIMSKLFGDDDEDDFMAHELAPEPPALLLPPSDGDDIPEREGLWVTITPTSGASPFFDTLLILVISPLITLTIVYALLILRAKLRRRRWRAPKSVIDRLPVRTYHTVAASPGQTPRLPSPTSSSPATPLLQSGASRPRPRSRTTTGVLEGGDLLRVDSALQRVARSPSRSGAEGNQAPAPSEWKKYMGRQVECVVCLEEYIDGQSRVMSLPCGHEFHAECITPWLTTRRRTCPICKGDVVRSLARGSLSSPRYEPYHDDSDDDDDVDFADEAAAAGSGLRAGSPDRESEAEQGVFASLQRAAARPSPRPESWLSVLSSSLGLGANTQPGARRRADSDAGQGS